MNELLKCDVPTIVLEPEIYLENLLSPVFTPELRSQGKLDYPPVKESLKVQFLYAFGIGLSEPPHN